MKHLLLAFTSCTPLRTVMCACALSTALTPILVAGECSPWDTAIGSPGMNGTVRVMEVLSNGDLIAGGQFTMAGGVSANRIARWDGVHWHALGEGLNNAVAAVVELPNGDIIAAGGFSIAGGEPANRIARWDGEQWHSLGHGFANGVVWSLATMPGSDDVIAGGSFTHSGGTAVNYIARWDGTQWHPMDVGMDFTVRALEVLATEGDPVLYAGGDFVTAGNTVVNHIARWDAGNAQWLALDQGVNKAVAGMTAFENELYVTGQITHAGKVPLFNPVGKWDGANWWPFSGGLESPLQAMTVFDDGTGAAIYAISASDAGPSSHRLIKWDGSWWMTMAEFTSPAFALASGGDALHIGGRFTKVGEAASAYVVSWHACPSPEPVLRRVPSEYSNIQSAINAADNGDVVLVAPGTYMEAIELIGKTIVVQSEAGAEETVIDATGQASHVAVRIEQTGVGTALRGFTVTGASNESADFGQGIRIADATCTIDACHVVSNGYQTVGGGIVIAFDADVLVKNSVIANNLTHHNGAGVLVVANRGARLWDCVMSENSSQSGSGAIVAAEPEPAARASFIRCTFVDNIATFGQPGWGAVGAGANNSGIAFFGDCLFQNNTAASAMEDTAGGGLYVGGETAVRNSQFVDNFATMGGGGVASFPPAQLSMIACELVGNEADEGGGLLAWGQTNPEIKESHFCDNQPTHITGLYIDLGGNTFSDTCEATPGDFNGDGAVDVADLLILLAAWGDCPTGGTPVPPCPADLTDDGVVDVSDLLALLANWG